MKLLSKELVVNPDTLAPELHVKLVLSMQPILDDIAGKTPDEGALIIGRKLMDLLVTKEPK